MNRRKFLRLLGIGGAGALAIGFLRPPNPLRHPGADGVPGAPPPPFPAPPPRNATYSEAAAGRALSAEADVLTYNNFYEFSTEKKAVARLAQGFSIDPYALTVDGLVDRPGTYDLAAIEALGTGLEERVYRFRCVEAWAMTVPWSGVPLAALLRHVGVRSGATHVAFTSVADARMPGLANAYFPWPYREGLRMDEAMHDLAFIATGLYGKRLAPQSGAPLRIVVPWKYGYKGPKSVVRMTLVDREPQTFWHDSAPDEYPFLSNVDPTVPHPRWSQATEQLLGSGDRIATLPFNGYGEQVAALYR